MTRGVEPGTPTGPEEPDPPPSGGGPGVVDPDPMEPEVPPEITEDVFRTPSDITGYEYRKYDFDSPDFYEYIRTEYLSYPEIQLVTPDLMARSNAYHNPARHPPLLGDYFNPAADQSLQPVVFNRQPVPTDSTHVDKYGNVVVAGYVGRTTGMFVFDTPYVHNGTSTLPQAFRLCPELAWFPASSPMFGVGKGIDSSLGVNSDVPDVRIGNFVVAHLNSANFVQPYSTIFQAVFENIVSLAIIVGNPVRIPLRFRR